MFCSEPSYTLHASVNEVLEFLMDLSQQGFGYSALNTAKSALFVLVRTDRDNTVGANSVIVCFMKGVFELRTPLPWYEQTWNISVLLKYFKQRKENSVLSLKKLSYKLCGLLLLVSAQRVKMLHLIRLSCVQMHARGCTIHLVDKMKTSRPEFHLNSSELPLYEEDEKLCVVWSLQDSKSQSGIR